MFFATCLNCVDGRAQTPVLDYITNHFECDYVDMITEPGVDGLFADPDWIVPESIIQKIGLSLGRQGPSMVFLVGHHDCLANPVDDETHKTHIKKGVKRIKTLVLKADVFGLWVEKDSTIKKIC